MNSGADPAFRFLFLGYLWKVARALHRSGSCRLLAVGVEPQRARSAEAIAWCEREGIEHFDARHLIDSPRMGELLSAGVDLCVVGALGQILPPEFLAAFPAGCLNVHFSRLPAYRGGCPIEEQILAGEREGGVSLHWITEGVDEGPLAVARGFEILADDDYAAVFEKAHEVAAVAMTDLLASSPSSWPRIEQRGGAPPTPPRRRMDGLIDWYSPAAEIERLVRADGWRGWVRGEWSGGQVLVHRARAEAPGAAELPGTVLEGGGEPLVAAGRGALRLADWEGELPPEGHRFSLFAGLPGQAPRVAMMQPTFLPWLGFFSLIADASLFVFLDDFQFCRRSWHQRNRLFLPGGKTGWITVPVEHPGTSERIRLDRVRPVLEPAFRRKTLESIRHAYSSAPFFGEVFPLIEEWIGRDWPSLAEMNMALIGELAARLGLETLFVRASDYAVEGARSIRIARLLEVVGAKSYLAAAGSASYMLEDGVFPLEGIATFFQRFEPRAYPQVQSEEFVPSLSALDALMQVGVSGTRALLRRGRRPYRGWDEVEPARH